MKKHLKPSVTVATSLGFEHGRAHASVNITKITEDNAKIIKKGTKTSNKGGQ